MAKFRYYNTKACYICPKCFFKIAGKSNNYQFYLPASSNFVTISHINYWTKSISGKIYENSGMVHFAEKNQAPSPYSMLQYVSRVVAPKLVSKNCLGYLQTTSIMGVGGLVSEFMWGIVKSVPNYWTWTKTAPKKKWFF